MKGEKFLMNHSSRIKVQQLLFSDCTDDMMVFLRQMGVEHVSVLFRDQHTDYDSVMYFLERLRQNRLIVDDAGNRTIYKNAAIHLGLPERDEGIEKYLNFSRILSKGGVPVTYMTWEPNGVLSTEYGVGKHTREGVARLVNVEQLSELPYSHGRFYSKDEMWENFRYFLDRTLPEFETMGMKISLHPNDPPVAHLRGISNLICSAEDYRKAFQLAGNSPCLGMKMCIGCWLEGGAEFGDVFRDIPYFVGQGKVLSVHFRNVSSCVPCFEETMLEDGYMDMLEVMKAFVKSGYQGPMSVDHVPDYVESCGGKNASFAYSIGYMKALLHSAEAICEKEI